MVLGTRRKVYHVVDLAFTHVGFNFGGVAFKACELGLQLKNFFYQARVIWFKMCCLH